MSPVKPKCSQWTRNTVCSYCDHYYAELSIQNGSSQHALALHSLMIPPRTWSATFRFTECFVSLLAPPPVDRASQLRAFIRKKRNSRCRRSLNTVGGKMKACRCFRDFRSDYFRRFSEGTVMLVVTVNTYLTFGTSENGSLTSAGSY